MVKNVSMDAEINQEEMQLVILSIALTVNH